MSTVYFQYTAGNNKILTSKSDKINKYMEFIENKKIMIPTHVKITISNSKYKKHTFREYLDTLEEIPTLKSGKEAGIIGHYKTEFIKNHKNLMKKFKRDMAKICDYVLKNNKYKTAIKKNKKALGYINNLKSINIGLDINRTEFKLTNKKQEEVAIDLKNKQITVKYDSNLEGIIDKLDTLNKTLSPKPTEITLELEELKNDKKHIKFLVRNKNKFDDADEYNTLYKYFYANEKYNWSLNASELYEDLNPNK